MSTFLKPLVEAAGYRVATRPGGEVADVVLAMADGPVPPRAGVPTVVLRAERAETAGPEGSIYRYDRDAVLDALRRSVSGARA